MIYSTGAKIITHLLKEHGIKTVAGIPGASVLPLYDELCNENINHILVRHEQSAGFIAQGIARSTELPAVCIATSGPGALNLLTAIADAKADSIPLIAITGQVHTNKIGTDAFQEADIFGLSMPITKHSILVTSALELLEAIPKAFSIALEGRPGPVLIDIPVNVQTEKVCFAEWPSTIYKKTKISKYDTPEDALREKTALFAQELHNAKNPLILIGGGCKSLMASSAINQLLGLCKIPVVATLMGLGVVPSNYEKFIGMIGIYGNPNANIALKSADLILALGVRFDNRSVGKAGELSLNAKILQIDIDACEINKLQSSYCGIVGDVRSILPLLNCELKSFAEKKLGASASTENIATSATRQSSASVVAKITSEQADTTLTTTHAAPHADATKADTTLTTTHAALHADAIKADTTSEQTTQNGASLVKQFANILQCENISLQDTIIVTDVGLHQMWVANGFPFYSSNQFLTSASLGTMGFGLPAAIGAAIANPSKKVILFSGDASILMNVQELATLKELNSNVTIIVLDNSTLGMVYQMQEKLYKKRHTQTKYKQPTNIAKVAEAFNIPSRNIDYKAVFENPKSFSDFAFGSNQSVLLRCSIPSTWT